jgi:hypothetical protein
MRARPSTTPPTDPTHEAHTRRRTARIDRTPVTRSAAGEGCFRGESVVHGVLGDSAGGNLAVAVTVAAVDQDLALPASVATAIVVVDASIRRGIDLTPGTK